MLFLGIFYYIISLVFTIASAKRSIKNKEYCYEHLGETIAVIFFILVFCWATIPAEFLYFFIREDSRTYKVGDFK